MFSLRVSRFPGGPQSNKTMAVANGGARGAVAPPPVKKPPLKNNRNQT